mmetsp:Transcript_38722/g.128187  ORF Transcript_38722/g.128187 Transcript_38722/m.128187 type:complete len:235 (+) Transcript_38722:481-1185(+)
MLVKDVGDEGAVRAELDVHEVAVLLEPRQPQARPLVHRLRLWVGRQEQRLHLGRLAVVVVTHVDRREPHGPEVGVVAGALAVVRARPPHRPRAVGLADHGVEGADAVERSRGGVGERVVVEEDAAGAGRLLVALRGSDRTDVGAAHHGAVAGEAGVELEAVGFFGDAVLLAGEEVDVAHKGGRGAQPDVVVVLVDLIARRVGGAGALIRLPQLAGAEERASLLLLEAVHPKAQV